jgi:small subunit ribosomal protein S2
VSEANKLGIPVIAIADTNADPDLLTVPIAGNDDAIRSVSVIAKAIGDSIIEARAAMPADERRRADEAEATTYSTETGESTPADDDKKGQKRRPRRKRRPKPEVIANLRGGGDEEGSESRSGFGSLLCRDGATGKPFVAPSYAWTPGEGGIQPLQPKDGT